MIKRKTWYKKVGGVLIGTVLVTNMLSSIAINAEPNNELVESEVNIKTEEKLKALVNPILQDYKLSEDIGSWSLTESSKLIVNSTDSNVSNERLAEVVKLVNSEFVEKEIVNNPLAMVYGVEGELSSLDIIVDITEVANITDETNSDEAYKIDITDDGIKVNGASENAVLHALRTIEALMITNNGLPYGTIVDYPELEQRKLHVDCARKYFSKDWFIQKIREMSYLKMNALQMHFSENKGFRIECETDPAIVSEEYLTKEEVREIIAEANKYGISIIPSFDTPGHVDYILRVHPEYGQISNKGTHYASGLDVTNREAIDYFKSLYREYMELFEGCEEFHIGADEYMEFDRAPFTTEYKSVLNDYAAEILGEGYTWKDALVNYINEISDLVEEGGFKARIWNDGVYYGENSYEGSQKLELDKEIGIDYWSHMPWNYSIARIETFIAKGHTNVCNMNSGYFYYVLRGSMPGDGRDQSSFDYLDQDKRIYDEWTPGKFPGSDISDDTEAIKGAAMGIWCDVPEIATEDVITEDISKELRSLATKAWNTESNSIATLDEFRETYTLLGNVAGFEKGSEIIDSGEILPSEATSKVTIKYVDENGIEIKDELISIGELGDEFTFEAPEIYGYRLVSEDATVSGTYGKEETVITFVYELSTNRVDLENEINNKLSEADYIEETFSEYKDALEAAMLVNNKEDATQEEVDEALDNLLLAKEKAVKLEYYRLYIETKYPLLSDGFVSGYDEYEEAIEDGKDILYKESVTLEEVNIAFENIKNAKENLMKADGNIPTVTASDITYTHSGASWQGPYFPPEKYAKENIVDGDLTTKAWFADNQNVGDEIAMRFAQPLNMSEIKVIQPDDVGADIIQKADVEIALEDGQWTKVGELTSEDGREITISFEKTEVKYVRFVIKEDSNKWYQIAEVQFTYDQIEEDNALRNLIVEAEELNIEGKDSKLVSDMINAAIEAQKAYVGAVSDTTEIQEALRNAIDALKDNLGEVDKTYLINLLNKIDGLNDKDYIPSQWTELEEKVALSEDIISNEDATENEVLESYKVLFESYLKLRLKPGKDNIEHLLN